MNYEKRADFIGGGRDLRGPEVARNVAQRVSAVSAGLSAVSGSIAELHDNIALLHERLSPVMSAAPTPQNLDGSARTSGCALSSELFNLEDRVSTLNTVVADMLSRLEI